MTETRRPRFSVVSAVYDVAPYLPDFIASIERQDFDLDRVEVVMVDDGSTDESRTLLEDWAARRPDLVRVLVQENAGQGAARNAGLAAATGDWVTFPDPDDVVEPDYLSKVDEMLASRPDIAMVATHRLLWNETTGEVTNTHPLRTFFSYDRVADLDVAESSFHGSAPAAFFDRAVIARHGLEFDTRIRPNFEDGHFCSSYLLHCERPVVGFLKSARYHYRKRADQSSSLQGSMLHPGRYTDVFEFGYEAILEEARRLRGAVPLWLQHFLCYELIGYLRPYESGRVPVLEAGPEIDAFHASMRRIVDQLDLDRVVPRLEFPVADHYRLVMLHGYDESGDWHEPSVQVDRFDEQQRLARLRYYFTGDTPSELVTNGEVPVVPRHAKVRDLGYFGRVLLRERVMWVPVRPDLRVALNGTWAAIAFDERRRERIRVAARLVRRSAGSPSRRDRELVHEAEPNPTTPVGRRAQWLASRRPVERRFSRAWVVMDRVHDAGDSGEILFRRLRTAHPDVNAWFVIEKGTPDWRRLRREFGRRVVAHGSLTWRLLMLHCTDLLSSHADAPIMAPPALQELGGPRWRFTFLQHGVIKDDLSSWLGGKPIDLFVTSTPAEHASIAGDHTGYPFTTKEVQLTGLPRFDRLLEIGDRFPPDRRDLVLVTPTWRQWLVHALAEGSQRRELTDSVIGSDFVQQWLAVLRSPALADECNRRGLTLAFLPHPNLQQLLPQLDLPGHVRAFRYDEGDVQELFARARVLLTDYSSIAFNAAYLERPVVYFQFDEELVLTGGHVGRRGYFDYRTQGFGPVTATVDETVDAVLEALAHGPGPAAPYAERVAETFPDRDGRCSDRVIAAVRAASRPATDAVATPAPTGTNSTRPFGDRQEQEAR